MKSREDSYCENQKPLRTAREKIELLAPAGSYEAFEAALGAGADAVYAGGPAFGARAYAQNFTEAELLKAIDAAHIHGKKLYLAVNTLLKNRELERQLTDFMMPCYEAGLDGVIVQDFGVFSLFRERFPDLPLHASTQMTVTGPAGMKFLEELGASRVVPARELGLSEIRRLHEASPIEIETFIHGALCYSYSGQCLMSSILGGRSGNRGRCAGTCRLPYLASVDGKRFTGKHVHGGADLCPLSLKDICTLDILPEILDAGVTSLKIEGRMKQPAYTAGVTAIYRKYLDLFLKKGAEGYRVEEKDRKYLLDLFNRGGSCTGYYRQTNGPSMMAFTNEKKTGDVSGEFRKRKENLYGNFILFSGSPVILEAECRGVRVSVSLGEAQAAENRPLTKVRIREQLEKLGNTPYQWEHLEILTDENSFVPMKTLNEIRRMALEELTKKLLAPHRRDFSLRSDDGHEIPHLCSLQKIPQAAVPPLYVSCETKETAAALVTVNGIKGMYLPFDAMKEELSHGLARGLEMYLSLPRIIRGEAPEGFWEQAKEWLSMGMKGFFIRSLEGFAMARERGYLPQCVTDHNLYSWNDRAAAFWHGQGILRDTVPLELNEGELRHRDNSGSEMLIYGYLPLMVSAQCVRKNLSGCDRREAGASLRDRKNIDLPVQCVCHPWKTGNTEENSPCYNIIFNGLPFSLLDEKKAVGSLRAASLRLSFTIERPEAARQILNAFLDIWYPERTAPSGTGTAGNQWTAPGRSGRGEPRSPSGLSFTRGHFKRGVQ